jgi:signal transduction protein with GAF and PtsI domain
MRDLEQELQQKTAELAALREIGRAINASWDLRATLDLITRQTAEALGMDCCSIYLLDESAEYLVLMATTGLALKAVGRARLRLGEGLTGWAAKTGQAVGAPDAAADWRFKPLPETNEEVFRSLLAVPLVHQQRVVGAMNVQTRGCHEYSTDEIELLSLIADLAAGALEKAVLYERMQRQIGELSTLAEVSETVTSPLYPDEMLELIVEMASRAMRAKVCSLQLLDEERNELIPRAIRGLNPAYREQQPIHLGEGIAGMVAASGQPLVVEDVRQDSRYRYPDIARDEGLCSLLCVPLRVRERVIGVFNCYTGEPHRFTADEVSLFSTLANQTALAIENARLATSAVVVREMHHRIKNNLQSVVMLLRLQMDEGLDPAARGVLHEAINRIQSIAAVHEVLSHRGLQLVDVKELLGRVATGVVQNMVRPGLKLDLSVEGEALTLPSQPATSLALVVNELVQNAVEHAYGGRTQGHIIIELDQEPGYWVVAVCDDGLGLPEGSTRQLGLQIVETLVVEDLRGAITLTRNGGTKATIRIPRQRDEGAREEAT